MDAEGSKLAVIIGCAALLGLSFGVLIGRDIAEPVYIALTEQTAEQNPPKTYTLEILKADSIMSIRDVYKPWVVTKVENTGCYVVQSSLRQWLLCKLKE